MHYNLAAENADNYQSKPKIDRKSQCSTVVLTLLYWRPAIPMEKGKNWGYQNSETPDAIVTKFGMGDYVGDMTQQAKIQTDRPSGGVPANG